MINILQRVNGTEMTGASDSLKTELMSRLSTAKPDRVVFVGVGNRMRGDDGIGPVLIDLLNGRVSHALDAGGTPENFTGAVKRLNPAVIVFLDALDFGASPGCAKIIESADIMRYGMSTHTFSLDVVMDYLEAETGAAVFLIGVQSACISHMPGLTPVAEKFLKDYADIIVSALRK